MILKYYSIFILLFSILTHCVFKRAKKKREDREKLGSHISSSWTLILPSPPLRWTTFEVSRKKVWYWEEIACFWSRFGGNTFFIPKETEARLIKKFYKLNKEQHYLSYLSECWWSTLRHIFKTLKSVDY